MNFGLVFVSVLFSAIGYIYMVMHGFSLWQAILCLLVEVCIWTTVCSSLWKSALASQQQQLTCIHVHSLAYQSVMLCLTAAKTARHEQERRYYNLIDFTSLVQIRQWYTSDNGTIVMIVLFVCNFLDCDQQHRTIWWLPQTHWRRTSLRASVHLW